MIVYEEVREVMIVYEEVRMIMIVYEEVKMVADTEIHTPYTRVRNSVSRKNIFKFFSSKKIIFFIYFSYLYIKKHTFIYSQ